VVKLFFIVALRNFLRDKLTSSIQLLGLIIGISSFLLVQLYVDNQKSYNTQFAQAENIYRVNLTRDDRRPQAATTLALAKSLVSNFTQVDDTTRVARSTISVKHQQTVFSERVLYADNNYFEFFDFELLEGDIHTALNAPDGLVLHEDWAQKYFGQTTGVIGSRLTVNGKEHQVTAIVKKTQQPNTMPITLIVPMENFYRQLPALNWAERWNFAATVTFAKITDNSAIDELAAKLAQYYDDRTKGISSYKKRTITFQPLLDIYLDNNTAYSLVTPGSKVMVTVFSIISLMILLLACVNFTNLATAAAMRRGKDVGVRKALGASKGQLICQYLFEAILLTSAATLMAIMAVQLLIPAFNLLMNTDIALTFSLLLTVKLISLTLLVALIAGSYPAFYLSNLSPALVLKGLINSSVSGTLLRKGLIILQFTIAAFLIVSSLIVNEQMLFIKNMPQGFDRENVIVISRGEKLYDAFKNQASRHPDVVAVTMSHTVPTKSTRTSNTVRRIDDISTEIWAGNNPVSYDFFRTYGINIISGRDFSKAFINDAYQENKNDWQSSKGKIIINQTLASALGYTPEEAVGQMITLGGGNDGLHNHQVIAVVEDSHYSNAKNTVPPMTYDLSAIAQERPLRWIGVRLKAGASQQSVKDLEQIWLNLDGNLAFKYSWLSDLFSASYRNENQQTQLLSIFTLLAILVTAIGLFGLAAFNTQRRVKEIAVRKVLGASTSQLCLMLVNQFSSLVVVANMIGLPIAYFLMRDWLNDFVYRIDMPYSAFVLSAIGSLAIAYCTVMFIAYQAATAKPVDSLSCE